ncbi:MAG TPA: hypothetical protein VEA69_03780 [Tepidisphaeraceae bacterium]|nr:hypothetical protein [Tepidisphaeraceae bacterium]
MVTLNRPCPGGHEEMVSWIPQALARKGLVVDLKDNETGRRTCGWTVMDDGTNPRPYRTLNARSRDYKKTRDASDI